MPAEIATSPLKFSIIMPAYNEGHHIHANLIQVCEKLTDLDFEVILVDDGSQDSTLSESQRVVEDGYPVQALRLEVNLGKGKALYHGFSHASGEIICFLDADLEIPPDYVLRLWEEMQNTGAEVVIGTKTPMDNTFPLVRRLTSIIFRRLTSFLFGLSITDSQTGIKLLKREVLEDTMPRSVVSRFAFDIELLIAASRFGYRIAECPVDVVYSRTEQMGRIRLSQMIRMLFDTLVIYYRASFWRWLNPGLMTKVWMITFVVGVFLLGIGIGKLITPLVLQPPISQIFRIIALQFLPLTLRNWLLVIIGGTLLILSLIQLNKRILDAFARRDHGDLEGILRRK